MVFLKDYECFQLKIGGFDSRKSGLKRLTPACLKCFEESKYRFLLCGGFMYWLAGVEELQRRRRALFRFSGHVLQLLVILVAYVALPHSLVVIWSWWGVEDVGKSFSGELVGWPTANCPLVTKVMKMMKVLYRGFYSDKLTPVTLKSYRFNLVYKVLNIYTLNLLI